MADCCHCPAATASKTMPIEDKIALAGNPNCGKTTLFNTYTGSKQHVGNYPGVTIDRKEGYLSVDGKDITLIDLPGTYSLTAYSQEELVARGEMSFGRIGACIDVMDSSALERNLVLAVQIAEMGMPIVLACNMMDEFRKSGGHIDMEQIGLRFGAPCLPLVAKTGEGSEEVLEAAMKEAAKGRKEPLRISYGRDIDEALLELEKTLADKHILACLYHPRWTAIKLIEGDPDVKRCVAKEHPEESVALFEYCRKIEDHVRKSLHASCESIMIDSRYGFIRSILANGVFARNTQKDRLVITDKIDKVLTNTVFGPLVMIAVLYIMFWLTFSVGAYPQEWLQNFFEFLGGFAGKHIENDFIRSLIVDGIIRGVGGVISFVPLIAIMFALIAFVEDSGYMARIAYMLDRIFRIFGLHGASVMPYIVAGGIAGGCAIPGVMATRTMRSPKEKLATLLTLPYMPCGAKVPVFLLLIGTFFPNTPALAFFLLLATGWISALSIAFLFRHTFIRGKGTPFVMELPPYRLPTSFSMLLHCWERTWMYLKKAGTVILAISIVIWAGMTFPTLSPEQEAVYTQKLEQLATEMAQASEGHRASFKEQINATQNALAEAKLQNTIAGRIGIAIEPVTEIAGFTWRTNVALLAGVAAKEAIVSTLGTAYSIGKTNPEKSTGLGQQLQQDPKFSKAVAISLMLFVLLYSPCFVALVVIKTEAGGWRWLIFSIIFNTTLAFGIASAAFKIASAIL